MSIGHQLCCEELEEAYRIEAGPLDKRAAINELVKPGTVLAQDVSVLEQPEEYIDVLHSTIQTNSLN